MSCSKCQKNMRSWLRGELSGEVANAVEEHLNGCYFCAAVVERESAILGALQRQHSIPEPSTGFQARVLAKATSHPADSRWPTFSVPVVGGAVAAALALGVALGVGFQTSVSPGASEQLTASGVEVTNEQADSNVSNVRLVFNTARALENVTLTVQLPAHVEVAGYPGYQRLSWRVSLNQGENVVKLPLNVLFPGEGQLVAQLNDGEREKTFRTTLSQTGTLERSEPVL